MAEKIPGEILPTRFYIFQNYILPKYYKCILKMYDTYT